MLAVAAVVMLVAGCGGRARERREERRTDEVRTVVVAGVERSYRLHTPAGLSGAAPLVVMLHGGFGSAEQAEDSYGWNAVADREHFRVAYPDGLNRAWNVGAGCCGRPGRDGVDDVGFVAAVVADVAGTDPGRVYATGISNGGMLSHRLACDTDLFAAIGPVAGTLLGPCPDPRPVSVLAVHGLADRAVRFDGAPGTGVAEIDGPPVPAVLAAWRAADRCPAPTVTRSGPVTTSTADCPDGRTVSLVTVDGAGHQWPGSESVRAAADAPSDALDATATLWAFFAAHPG